MSARNRMRLLPLALLLASVATGSIISQEERPVVPATPPGPGYNPETFRDERAEKILRAAIDAQGGEAALLARKTVYFKRRITRFDAPEPLQGTITVWFKRPLKLRQEVAYAHGRQIRVFDGEKAWVDEGEGPKLLGPMMGRMMERGVMEIDSPLIYLEGSLRYLNVAKDLNGNLTQKLSWRSEGYARDLMVDVATSHLSVVGEFDTPAGASSLIKHFEDFRPVERVVLPFKQSSLRNEQKYSETEMIEVRFNEPIDDSLFEFPGPAESD